MITFAVVAAWRVTGLVTPVASRSVVVAAAATTIATYGSLNRFWESANASPVQPCASARRATSADRRGSPMTAAKNSMPIVGLYNCRPAPDARSTGAEGLYKLVFPR